MSLIYLVGSGYNQIARAVAEPVVGTGYATGYPPTNVANGKPWEPLVFGTADVGYLAIDLNQIVNGGFEDAFSGGLPGAGWGQSSGATLSRSTVAPLVGTADLEVDGEGESAYFDHVVSAGEVLNLTCAAKGTAVGSLPGAKMLCQNLASGSFLKDDFTWSAAENAWGFGPTEWQVTSGRMTVEDYATCQVDRPTLRWYFRDEHASDSAFFDEFYVWPRVNFVSIHGHNGSPGCRFRLHSGNVAALVTLRAELTIRRPTMFSVLGVNNDRYDDRYWALAVRRPAGRPQISLSEMVLGQYQTSLRRQNYGQDLGLVDVQDRTASEIGPLQAFLRGDVGRREVAMQFKLASAADYAQRKEILERSRNGAYPMVVVVESDDPTSAVLGRVADTWRHTRQNALLREDTLTLAELPMVTDVVE